MNRSTGQINRANTCNMECQNDIIYIDITTPYIILTYHIMILPHHIFILSHNTFQYHILIRPHDTSN